MKKSSHAKVNPYDLQEVSRVVTDRSVVRVRPTGGSAYDLTRVNTVNAVRSTGVTVKTTKR